MRTGPRHIVFALLALSLPPNAQIRYKQLPIGTIQSRLAQAKRNDMEREQTLKQMFADAGCKDIAEVPVKRQKAPNVICTMPGTTDRVIVVGAHFDHDSHGTGVVDNWSGASLLPSLVESISEGQLRHTIVFVGFTGEEQGLVGSQAYVKSLKPEALSKFSAMINFDTLGLSPTKVWASHGNAGLVNALVQMANTMKLPLSAMNVDGVASSDSESFRVKNIPALTIHSVTRQTLLLLHSQKDNMDAINMEDYYATYRLSAAYIVMLDQGLDVQTASVPATAEAQASSH